MPTQAKLGNIIGFFNFVKIPFILISAFSNEKSNYEEGIIVKKKKKVKLLTQTAHADFSGGGEIISWHQRDKYLRHQKREILIFVFQNYLWKLLAKENFLIVFLQKCLKSFKLNCPFDIPSCITHQMSVTTM